jgi:hypothetical protein
METELELNRERQRAEIELNRERQRAETELELNRERQRTNRLAQKLRELGINPDEI